MSATDAGYVELHCHSVFSLQDGAGEPETLIGRARALGMSALALTDHDDLGGAVRFAQAAATAEVGGILGVELTVRVPARTHLVLLAETREGYGNLCSLVTRARLDTPRGDPSVTLDTLARHANGLVALTGCPRGWVPRLVARGEDDTACTALATLADIFERRVWVECWDHHLPEERAIVRGLLACARALGLPWVVTNDVHYVHARDRIVHDVLLALKHKLPLDQMGTRLRPNGEWYLKGAAQVRRRWQHDDAGVRATLDVAERCAFRLGDLKPSLPVFALPPGVSADEYLTRLVAQGAHERWGPPGTARRTAKHDAQLRHEIGMIARLGLAGYFLIVWDIVRFARREGILCQGRGSAANSAVCYCLAITAVDPVKLELLFERFLSEERKEAPDIDIDIAHEERERVLQYVYERYGREHAAMVCEHITWRGRSAVRDAARVLGFSVEQADALAMFSDRFSAKATAEALRTGRGADPFAPAWEDTVGPANYEKERDAARALCRSERSDGPADCHPERSEGPADCRPERSDGPADCRPERSEGPADCRPERSEGPASAPGDKQVLRSAQDDNGRRSAQDDRREADRIGQAMMPGRRSVERMQEDRAVAERLGRGMVRGTEATTLARRVKAEARGENSTDKSKGKGLTTEAQRTQRTQRGAVSEEGKQVLRSAQDDKQVLRSAQDDTQVLRSAQDDTQVLRSAQDDTGVEDPTARAIAGVSEGDALLRRVGLDPNDHRVRMLPAIVAGLHQAPRHRSIHVGGFVLTREPLLTVVPIEPASMADRTVIQWEKDDLDPVGLVKIDLLGLGMLTVLQLCLTYVRQVRGITIDLGQLDMADQSVFDDLCAADTIGVFQVESRAQMNTLPRLKPRCFYDLVVEVALIRPGPIQGEMVHPYLRRKNGEEPVTYPHPSLEPILKRTLGVPLFQEQGMQVAIAAAGFTPGQADLLRRAMGHKRSHERMAAICEQMIEGMKANGIPDDIARRIYNQINAFADYGFPESHAASFALIVYASAYLRHYYAPEYLAAMLNAQPMGFYAPGTLIEDAKRHGVEVRAVDLTVSGWDHALERCRPERSGCRPERSEGPASAVRDKQVLRVAQDDNKQVLRVAQDDKPAVRLGLRLVRGLGSAARTKLETALADGPFTSIADVVQRTQLDRKALRVLAESGAFDTMVAHEPPEKRRRAALWQVLAAERGAAGPLAPRRASDASGTERVPAMTRLALTEADYRMTGVSLAGHPMTHARAALKREGARTARELLSHGRDDTWATTAGLVICRQRPGTAKGFVFLTLEDETGMLNVVITPKLFEQHALLVTTTPLLVVRGVLQVEGRVVNLKARAFRALDVQAGAEHYRSHDFR